MRLVARPAPPVPDGPGATPDGGRRRAGLLLLWCAPVVWVPGAFVPVGPGGVAVAALGAALLLAAPARGAALRLVPASAAILAAVLAAAALLGPTPVASLLGRWPRYEGLPWLLLLTCVVVASARGHGVDERTWRRSTRVLGCVSLLLAATTLAQAAGVPVLASAVERPGGLVGNATDLGVVAAMLLVVLGREVLAGTAPATGPVGAGALAAVVTLVASGSRGAVLLAALAALALLVGRRPRPEPRGALLAGAGLMVTAVASLVLLPTLRSRLTDPSTLEGRARLWATSGRLARDHLALGLGPSRFVDAFAAREDVAYVRATSGTSVPDSPHALPLQLLLAGGVPLLLIGLLVAVVAARAAWSGVRALPWRAGAGIAVIVAVAATMANPTQPGSTLLAAALGGVLLARPVPAEHESRDGLLASGLVGAAAVLMLLGCAGVASALALQAGADDLRAGRGEAGIHRLTLAQRLLPWDADTSLLAAQLGAAAVAQGQDVAVGPTLAWSERSRRALPESAPALGARSTALLAADRREAALATAEQAARLAPLRAPALVQRVVTLIGVGRDAEAVAPARLLASLHPDAAATRRLTQVVCALPRSAVCAALHPRG